MTKILIIDDDRITRKILEVTLKSKGYEVFSASDPAEGLELATQEKPNLVILDVFMPGIDGWEVLGQLRSFESTRKIPVLMLTAADQMKSVETAFGLGANAYLAKPIQAARLHKKVEELLNQKN